MPVTNFQRLHGLFDYVALLPTVGGVPLKVQFAHLYPERAEWWHENVQKVIDDTPGLSKRADVGWRWPRILPQARWTEALGQQPRMFEMAVAPGQGFDEVPLALAAMVMHYPGLPDGHKMPFLWYLADAPHEALVDYLPADRMPKRIAGSALDAAVLRSFRNGNMGRLTLHAAPAGGQALVNWYLSCGLERFPPEPAYPAIGRHLAIRNDGRYFYYDVLRACNFSGKFDAYR